MKIDKLEAAGQKVKADSKTEYDNQVKNLKAIRAELGEKVENLRKVGDSAWKDLRAGVKSSLKTMDKAVRSAAANFKQGSV